MRRRGRSTALPKPMLVLLGIAAIAVTILSLASSGDADPEHEAAESAAVAASGLLAAQPREAALLALASYRLDRSTANHFAMLNVAAGQDGIERVIDTGRAEVTAAIRTERLSIVATSDRMLGVWRAADGALLGEVRTEHPITDLTESERTPLIAALDEAGDLDLLDLSDPHRLRLHRMYAPPHPERILALSFSSDGTAIYSLSVSGEVERVSVATGQRVDRFSLRELDGDLPWDREGRDLVLSAATFGIEDFSDEEPVTVATSGGAVARVELGSKRGETLVHAGVAPGRVTSIAVQPYDGPRLALGTTGGSFNLDGPAGEPVVERGAPVASVAFDYQNHLWRGSELGITMGLPYSGWSERSPAGGPVGRLVASNAGLLAIDPHGVVRLLGRRSTGLALPDVSTTTVASFGTHGELLTSEGFDANHIERLWTRRPGHTQIHGELVRSPKLRSYEPDPDWWPYAEEGSGLYVNDAALDDDLVVVGGQDPTGEAVVLVWDRRSGKPLRRLALDIGEVEGAPSIVTHLLLLPEKHMIAAYSTVQQLVAIWSTDTWRQLAAIPVGQVGDLSLSPDEETILATRTADEEAEPPGQGAKLIFIDSGDGRIRSEVAATGLLRAAWSPDGSRIATLDEDGRLELRSADGKPDLDPAIHFDRQPTALAWHPDGKMIAVGLESGGVAVIDAERGVSTPPLPAEANLTPLHLSWSRDGRFLAAATGSEKDEPSKPGPARIWTLGASRLERRMCQLAGGPLDPSIWHEILGDDASPRPLCARRRERRQNDVSDASRLVVPAVAYRSSGNLFAADWEGHVARIGSVDPESFAPVAFRWSGDAMAWESRGRLDLLISGEKRSRWWSCPCEGFGWRGGRMVALEKEGGALLEFDPDRARPRRVPLRTSVGSYPRLVGVVGDKAVVAGYLGEPTRATPNALYLVGRTGDVERLPGTTPGIVGPLSAGDPAARTLAFVASLSGGACYTSTKIGVLTLGRGGRPHVEYPQMPGNERFEIVRSLQVGERGAVAATIGPIGCRDNRTLEREPEGTRYVLRDGTWVATADRGGDVQAAESGLALLDAAEDTREGAPLRLLPADDDVVVVGRDVDEMEVRP